MRTSNIILIFITCCALSCGQQQDDFVEIEYDKTINRGFILGDSNIHLGMSEKLFDSLPSNKEQYISSNELYSGEDDTLEIQHFVRDSIFYKNDTIEFNRVYFFDNHSLKAATIDYILFSKTDSAYCRQFNEKYKMDFLNSFDKSEAKYLIKNNDVVCEIYRNFIAEDGGYFKYSLRISKNDD